MGQGVGLISRYAPLPAGYSVSCMRICENAPAHARGRRVVGEGVIYTSILTQRAAGRGVVVVYYFCRVTHGSGLIIVWLTCLHPSRLTPVQLYIPPEIAPNFLLFSHYMCYIRCRHGQVMYCWLIVETSLQTPARSHPHPTKH